MTGGRCESERGKNANSCGHQQGTQATEERLFRCAGAV